MADTTKKLIIDISLPGIRERVENLTQLRNSMDQLRAQQRINQQQTEAEKQAYIANEAQIKLLNEQYRQAELELKNFAKANQLSQGSVKQMQAQVSVLNREFYSLSEAERTNTARGRELSAQITELNKKINQTKLAVGDSTSNIGKYMQGMTSGVMNGLKTIAAGFAAAFSINAIKGFFTGSLEKYDIQIKAEAKLAAVLKSTGGAAGYTAEELKKMAAALQETTRYGDEEIINAQAVLATFTQVGREVFPDVIKVAMDMSSVLGTDLRESVLQLGKAFNEPTTSLATLRRSGVSFTKEQIEQIKALWESGKRIEAQTLMLRELQTEFGGASEAMAKVGKGPLKQLANLWTDFMEKLGGDIASGGTFGGFLSMLKSMVLWLNNNVKVVEKIVKEVLRFITVLVAWKLGTLAAAAAQTVYNTLVSVGTMAINAYRKATQSAKIAQDALNTSQKSNIWGLIASVVAIAVTYIWEAVAASKELTETELEQKRIQEDLTKSYRELGKEYKQEEGHLNSLFKTLKDPAAKREEQLKAIDEINKKYGEYLPQLLTEKSTLNDINIAYAAIAKTLRDSFEVKKKSAQLDAIYAELDLKNQEIVSKMGDVLLVDKRIDDAMANATEYEVGVLETRRGTLQDEVNKLREQETQLKATRDKLERDISKLKVGDSMDFSYTPTKTDPKKIKEQITEIELLGEAYKDAEEKLKALSIELLRQGQEIEIGALMDKQQELLKLLEYGEKNNYLTSQEYADLKVKLEERTQEQIAEIKQRYQLEGIEKEYKKQVLLLKNHDVEKLKAEEEYIRKKLELVKAGSVEELELLDELEENKVNQRKAQYDIEFQAAWQNKNQQYDLQREYLEKEIELETENMKRKAEFEEQLATLKQRHRQDEVNAVRDYARTVSDLLGSYYDYANKRDRQKLDDFTRNQDQEREELQKKLDSNVISQDVYDKRIDQLDQIADSKKRKLERKAASRQKTVAIFNTLINTAAGIAAALIGDPYTVYERIAVAAATGAAQLALIIAEPLPSAKKGRRIRGASHATSGEIVEAQEGEVIMNDKASRRYMPLLDYMQRMTGGTPFINDNGYAAAMAGNAIAGRSTAADLSKVNLWVSVEEINRGQARVQTKANRAQW